MGGDPWVGVSFVVIGCGSAKEGVRLGPPDVGRPSMDRGQFGSPIFFFYGAVFQELKLSFENVR